MICSEKLIILDVDGVLLNWLWNFDQYIDKFFGEPKYFDPFQYDLSLRYGVDRNLLRILVDLYNKSEEMRNLSPIIGSQEALETLKDHGYKFVILSSVHNDPIAHEYRIENLEKHFGKVFDRYIFLDTGAPKGDALKEFQGTNAWFIEDHIDQALLGNKAGIRTVLHGHTYNMHHHHPDIPMFHYWDKIEEHIIKNDTH